MPRIYIASRASIPARAAEWRRLRDVDGHDITSTWIDEAGPGKTADFGDLWQRILNEVTSADRLILYVEAADLPLKGAYVEVGMALAAGIPVTVVAPDIEVDPHTCRPLGSWLRHPLVTQAPTMAAALAPST